MKRTNREIQRIIEVFESNLGRIELCGAVLKIRGEALDLTRSPCLQRLFECFLSARSGVTTEELLDHVYLPDCQLEGDPTERFTQNRKHNIIKMVSRGRRLMERGFSFGEQYYWFAFDVRAQQWHFLRYSIPFQAEVVRLVAA